MPIEQDLTRIATALEVIANNIAAVGQQMGAKAANSTSMPPPAADAAAPPVTPDVDTRSPQQKAADTRKANKAKKDAEAKSNVTPITPAASTPPPVTGAPAAITPPPVAQPPVATAPPALEGELVPMDFTALKALTNETYALLEGIEKDKGLKEVGGLMATTYGVENLSAMAAEHYDAFARDLRALLSPVA